MSRDPKLTDLPPLPVDRSRVRSPMRRLLRAVLWLVGLLVAAVTGGGGWIYVKILASRPVLDGERSLANLSARLEIERDDLGVPTIKAATRADAARALGFLHAQDRFFQMDLLRRQAAGELAELFGPPAIPLDKEHRLHRFRALAGRVLTEAGADERELLEAYAAGVNAGLSSLKAKPFEYLAIRATPAPWKSEDSLLAVFAMYFELQGGDGSNERQLATLEASLPAPLFTFLTPLGTDWDAPLTGETVPSTAIPGPELVNLRTAPAPAKAAALCGASEPPALAGSNNWAVAGTHTADGKALLANDMHLGLSVPNTWYRARLEWREGDTARQVTGVTLPGLPSVAVGSNGSVAWGFTNSYGDWIDLVVLDPDPADAAKYLVPGGSAAYETVRETIQVRGGVPVPFEFQMTRWGPVVADDSRGRKLALAWTAHHPRALRLDGITKLERARSLDEAIRAAHDTGIPAQNFVVADSSGRIGWTIIGQIPRRLGFDGRLPTSWADGSRRWEGWLAPEEVPTVVDPPSGRIWTANNRTMDGEALTKIGDGGFDLGARARQIRDGLAAIDKATPRDLLSVQLDDRALFLERWRTLLLATLTPEAVAGKERRLELKRLVETTWTGRASTESASYRLVRLFRGFVELGVWRMLTEQQDVEEEKLIPPSNQFEGPLWTLLTARPEHLLTSNYASWDALLLEAVDSALSRVERFGPELAGRTWGERNTVRIQHPLSRAVPVLGRILDVPPRQLSGDAWMPRVQGPGFGASERLVVSPGEEEKGFFHMPVGQSGHPFSPYFQKGHEAWQKGEPTPFLPGPTVHRLTLLPAGSGGMP